MIELIMYCICNKFQCFCEHYIYIRVTDHYAFSAFAVLCNNVLCNGVVPFVGSEGCILVKRLI